ncbi:hypothetical protein [Streptomyces sp. NBC_01718]|uniref:hypothetical protein n=1 Tax=unclassified Streptomyces TaxID=2593676 RepID=UPI0030E5F75B
MSRSVDFDFTFKTPIDVPEVLHLMRENGVVFCVDGEFTYVLDETGMFDWQSGREGELEEVILEMGRARWCDGTVGISFLFSGSTRGGDLLFHPGRESVSFVVTVNRKLLPGSELCDVGWYMGRIIPILEPAGLVEVEYRDSP